jgi:hypothetical protein
MASIYTTTLGAEHPPNSTILCLAGQRNTGRQNSSSTARNVARVSSEDDRTETALSISWETRGGPGLRPSNASGRCRSARIASQNQFRTCKRSRMKISSVRSPPLVPRSSSFRRDARSLTLFACRPPQCRRKRHLLQSGFSSVNDTLFLPETIG